MGILYSSYEVIYIFFSSDNTVIEQWAMPRSKVYHGQSSLFFNIPIIKFFDVTLEMELIGRVNEG